VRLSFVEERSFARRQFDTLLLELLVGADKDAQQPLTPLVGLARCSLTKEPRSRASLATSHKLVA
jgi:hypothetical protein